jgi:hypothetical protein
MKPRPGYLFTARDCPNTPHPKPMEGRCGLCGTDVQAYRFGRRLAPWVSAAVFVIVCGTVLLLLLGCTPKPETPEEHFIASVRDAATSEAVVWTDALQGDAMDLGASVCIDLQAGKPMATIREETRQEDPRAEAIVQATVSAAAVHLCPGAAD